MIHTDDPYNVKGHFELQLSDGIHCAQVLVYDADDLQYWQAEAKRTGHLIGFDYHVSQGALFANDTAYNVYQIFPPEQAEKFKEIKLIE